MTQQNKQERAGQQPEGIEMGEQDASYGSSYSETTPGQTEANRRESLQEQDSTQRESEADDSTAR